MFKRVIVIKSITNYRLKIKNYRLSNLKTNKNEYT